MTDRCRAVRIELPQFEASTMRCVMVVLPRPVLQTPKYTAVALQLLPPGYDPLGKGCALASGLKPRSAPQSKCQSVCQTGFGNASLLR
jgi:hypothetical protein